MTPALVVILVWLAALLASCAAVGLQVARHGARGLALPLLCPLGALLMYGFVSAAAGLGEGAWGITSPGLWTALALGAAGVALEVVGWHSVLRRRLLPGQCAACGYDLVGLPACPECGKSR